MSKVKFNNLRLFVIIALFAGFIAATVKLIGVGTVCAYCPVGILQAGSASLSFTLDMLIILACSILFIIVLGRIFCGWGCPTAIMRRFFGVKHRVRPPVFKNERLNKIMGYSAYAVLAVSIVASFFVGFPVFCLICPIGLFFGFIFALHKVFTFYQPGWELLIFPAIIAAEIILFRSWCGAICPIGAFFKLVNKVMPRIVKLKSAPSCSRLNEKQCKACSHACPEDIAISAQTASDKENCTLCLTCKDACPQNAVEISVKK